MPTVSNFSLYSDLSLEHLSCFQFVQPTRSTFIYFYRSNGTLIHKIDVSSVNGYPQGSVSQTLAIELRLPFKEKEHYYILMDPGKSSFHKD